MEKCGLKFESLQKQHSFFKGGYQDLTLFVKVKEEWSQTEAELRKLGYGGEGSS